MNQNQLSSVKLYIYTASLSTLTDAAEQQLVDNSAVQHAETTSTRQTGTVSRLFISLRLMLRPAFSYPWGGQRKTPVLGYNEPREDALR